MRRVLTALALSVLGTAALAGGATEAAVAAPAPSPAGVEPSVEQLRINQRISQAAIRRLAALEAILDGAPPPTFGGGAVRGRVTLSVGQLRINQRIAQAAVRRANALAARLDGAAPPVAAPRAPGRVTLSAGQLLVNQRIAQAAVRRANALAERVSAPGPEPAPEAAGLRWQPLPSLPFAPAAAAPDGPGALVVGTGPRRLEVARLQPGRAPALAGIPTGTRVASVVLSAPTGRAAIVWTELPDGDGGSWRVRAAVREPGAQDFDAPLTLSAYPGPGFARPMTAAIGPDGTLLVAWWGGPEGGVLGIYAATRPPGGAWSAPVDVAAGGYPPPRSGPGFVGVGAAVGLDGRLAVTWLQTRPGSTIASEQILATRPPGGAWSAPIAVAGEVAGYQKPLPLAVAPDGSALTAWTEARARRPDGVAATTCVMAARVPPDATPSVAELACQDGFFPGRLRVTADPAGNALVAWQRVPNFGSESPLRASIQAFARPAGAAGWSPPRELVPEGRGFQDLHDAQPLGDGRFLVVSTLGQALPGLAAGGLSAVVVGSDGTPLATIPPPPGAELGDATRFASFASSGPGGLLLPVGAGGPGTLLRR